MRSHCCGAPCASLPARQPILGGWQSGGVTERGINRQADLEIAPHATLAAVSAAVRATSVQTDWKAARRTNRRTASETAPGTKDEGLSGTASDTTGGTTDEGLSGTISTTACEAMSETAFGVVQQTMSGTARGTGECPRVGLGLGPWNQVGYVGFGLAGRILQLCIIGAGGLCLRADASGAGGKLMRLGSPAGLLADLGQPVGWLCCKGVAGTRTFLQAASRRKRGPQFVDMRQPRDLSR